MGFSLEIKYLVFRISSHSFKIIDEPLYILFKSIFSISVVENINDTLFPKIENFSFFFNNFSSKFKYFKLFIISLYVPFIETGLLVGLQSLAFKFIISHFSMHSLVTLFSYGLKFGQ